MGAFANLATTHGWFPNHAKTQFLRGKIAASVLEERILNRAARLPDFIKRAELFSSVADVFRTGARIKKSDSDLISLCLGQAYAFHFKASDAYTEAAKLDHYSASDYLEKSRQQRLDAIHLFPAHPNVAQDAKALALEYAGVAKKSIEAGFVHSNGNGQATERKFKALASARDIYQVVLGLLDHSPSLSLSDKISHLESYARVLKSLTPEFDFYLKTEENIKHVKREHQWILNELNELRSQMEAETPSPSHLVTA